MIREMRRQQSIQLIVCLLGRLRPKNDLLQQHVASRIGKDFLFDGVAVLQTGIDDPVGWHTGGQILDARAAVPFFFGKQFTSVGHDQTQVANASLIDPRVVHLVQNPMAMREPDAAG